MTIEEWESLSSEKQEEIYQKCKESPAYFYNNFRRKKGDPEMTDEEFERMVERSRSIQIKGRRGNPIFLYPKTLKEVNKRIPLYFKKPSEKIQKEKLSNKINSPIKYAQSEGIKYDGMDLKNYYLDDPYMTAFRWLTPEQFKEQWGKAKNALKGKRNGQK